MRFAPLWRPSARTLFHGFGAPRACRYRKEVCVTAETAVDIMPRPRKSDPAVVSYAAAIVAERIVEEWDQSGKVEDWIEPLQRELRYSHRDGYELARELERYHSISPDRALVEILDDASYALDDAYADALEKWVKITGWTPRFAKGDRVTWRGKPGTVNDVKHKVGEYYFSPDEEAWRFANGGGYLVTEDALASGIETEGEDAQQLRAEHESPAPKGDAQC
jgi:hypothetical protein